MFIEWALVGELAAHHGKHALELLTGHISRISFITRSINSARA